MRAGTSPPRTVAMILPLMAAMGCNTVHEPAEPSHRSEVGGIDPGSVGSRDLPQSGHEATASTDGDGGPLDAAGEHNRHDDAGDGPDDRLDGSAATIDASPSGGQSQIQALCE